MFVERKSQSTAGPVPVLVTLSSHFPPDRTIYGYICVYFYERQCLYCLTRCRRRGFSLYSLSAAVINLCMRCSTQCSTAHCRHCPALTVFACESRIWVHTNTQFKNAIIRMTFVTSLRYRYSNKFKSNAVCLLSDHWLWAVGKHTERRPLALSLINNWSETT